jgi:hypothetical protein
MWPGGKQLEMDRHQILQQFLQGALQCQFDTQKRKKISERGIHNNDRW